MEEKKLVLIGLPESGKTTISEVISKGKDPIELLKQPLKPTKSLSVSDHCWLDINCIIFDTAGQNYQNIFKDENKQSKIFGEAVYIIYLIDYRLWSKEKTQERMIKDIETLKNILEERQYSSELLIFFHKIDLIEDSNRETYIKSVRESFEARELKIFFTSIHPDFIFSLYSSFYKILSLFSDKRKIIKDVLDEYLEDQSKTIFYVTNNNNTIVGLAMSPDFDIKSIEGTYNLAAQLNLTLEKLKSNDIINHLMLQTINGLNVIMNYLDLYEDDMKNLICISETLKSNDLIWKAGKMVTELRKKIRFK
ncbi:MAG: hypothetical protein EU547_03940 [Promethearchaeota archaeon]|nr:MAG: hypothetical protein EU547_03940 [Candidatus Lokiarchaeota archaeon]